MPTTTLDFNIKQKTNGRRIIVEMDAERFERMASDFGFFRPEFLESLDRAEQEISQKKIKRLRSLKDLRRS